MKKKLQIIALLLFQFAFSQNVNIPDSNFKAALISKNVDTNADGEISNAEAQAISYLEMSSKNISSLTGIEAFTNLTTLYFSYNNVSTVDLSALTNLQVLSCSNNKLTALNVSANANLTSINGMYNLITTMDVTHNLAL